MKNKKRWEMGKKLLIKGGLHLLKKSKTMKNEEEIDELYLILLFPIIILNTNIISAQCKRVFGSMKSWTVGMTGE